MRYKIIAIGVMIVGFMTGCREKKSTKEEQAVHTSDRISASPLYTAKFDYSKQPKRIDIEGAINRSPTAVRLSEIASSIEYYQIGDDKYPVTQIIAVKDGFIALNKPKIYLYRKGMKRKRVGLKATYNEWMHTDAHQSLYYDKETTCLYTYLGKIDQETGYKKGYVGNAGVMDSILARYRYLFPDSLPSLHPVEKRELQPMFDFTSTGYTLANTSIESETVRKTEIITKGLISFNLQGDTICSFDINIDPANHQEHGFGMNVNEFGKYRCNFGKDRTGYRYEDKLTFLLSYSDTIYRITNDSTITPTYTLSFGKYSISGSKNTRDLTNKASIAGLNENKKALLLKVFKLGIRNKKTEWTDDHSKKDTATEEFLMVHSKSSNQTIALPRGSEGLMNDLDNGLPFWPEGQTEDCLYMIRPAKEMKKRLKLAGAPKEQELLNFLGFLPDDQNVLIVVR